LDATHRTSNSERKFNLAAINTYATPYHNLTTTFHSVSIIISKENKEMTRFSPAILAAVALSMMNEPTAAFVGPGASATTRPVTVTSLSAEKADDASCSRRDALFGVAAAVFAATTTAAPQPAAAKYSDYARREKDWQERVDAGGVQVSTARDLKKQLREIAPQNNGASVIFCPNGQPSNVSPLMENKCGDRLATPSVFGRQNDATGNSVPGFKEGFAWGASDSSSMSAAVGGFPKYKENEWKIREFGN
jgi:hypothetical protein